MRTYEEINKKIANKECIVVTAEEIIKLVDEQGEKKIAEEVDVVTTGTFGPMCSSGVYLNFGHAEPPIKMLKAWLNDIPAYCGLAAVDAYIGAAELDENLSLSYGGAHVIEDLVRGKDVHLHDGTEVIFWYKDDNEVTHYVTMDVEESISAVIGHIPDRQFKTIRHYGVYNRGIKRKFKRLLGLVSIAQQKLTKFLELWVPKCPNCGCRMEYVWSECKKPPPKLEFGERISDWDYICLR